MPYEKFLDRRLFEPLGMKDTTFWPDEKQIARLAKSYKANSDSTALEETPVTQLMYPLNDRSRQPMPAGGLFSTAADLTRFCQMILSGGMYKGKRYLSEAALKQMTSVETGEIPLNKNNLEGYGFGWVVMKRAAADGRDSGSFGHGGAYKTMMWIDPRKDRIVILLRQHAGNDGNKVEPAFLKAVAQMRP
jgi:CubicO group peptidase (beta-lactamase class C family)